MIVPEHADFRALYLSEIGIYTPFPADRADSSGQITREITAEGAVPRPVRSQSEPASLPVISVADVADTVVNGNSLDDIAIQASTCTACQLAEQRSRVVFGAGNPDADIVFIGEAPGREEDLKGEPFVGRAGQLLDRMLAALGMNRSEVYIMNTVKCRPPNNRDPRPDEVEACSRWFDAQLRALSPKIICLLGRVSAQTVLETDQPLSVLRRNWHNYHGIPAQVMYHPAYLLRSPQQKRHAWSDLCRLKKRYDSLLS
ncbi:MAG: uracil-DNA glycosylase [Mariprofundaceae bacterium]|nr:uracil-DNA glycosylase [Mariprofundaceae bacterium]